MEVEHDAIFMDIGPNLAAVLIAVVSGLCAALVAWINRDPSQVQRKEENGD